MNRAALSPNGGVFTCSLDSRLRKGTRLSQLAVFADPVRACSAIDTLADKSGECRTRIERARQESGCRPNVAACCVLRWPSVACHADARHGVHKTAQTSATTWVVFFFGADVTALCTTVEVLGRCLNHVDEDRQHANDVNVPFSPVHQNTRLHTRDRTRGAANRRGRRGMALGGGTQQWNQRAGGRVLLGRRSVVRPQKETHDPGTPERVCGLRLLRLWARSGARSDRTSICLPSAASGQLCSMGESQWSKGRSGSYRRREVQI